MDENLARLNRIYPNGKYVSIERYDPTLWENTKYDSSHDSKIAKNRWKTSPLSYEQAQEEVEKGNRVGWVVPEGLVVVDIDNNDHELSQDYVEKILKKFEVAYSYNYTSKGIHILFRDPSKSIKTDSRTKCGLNIVIDTRANDSGYIVLPCNDPHRAWGYWTDAIEEIPYFMKPLLKDDTRSFIGMTDGDGRNDALFKWLGKIKQCHKLTKEEAEKCIRIINENLLQVAMTNKELFSTVLRDRNNDEKDRKLEKENIYNKMADEIVGRYDLISFYDNFYKFNGTYYEPIEDIEVERIIHYELNQNINKAGRSEILEFIKIKTQVKQEDFDKDWYKIACANGVLNLITGEVETPTKTDINTIYIPYAYNPDPEYSPLIDQFMKDLCNGDPLKMYFLYQIAGYCLLKKNLFEKFLIFKGEGGTGKSTYMNLLHKMVGGDKNTAHVGLANFDKDYYLSTLVSKLLNIDDDVVDGKALEDTGRFKSIVSGNIISVRQIYKAVLTFAPYATCMFSCNRLPRIMDNTTGLYRRMILIELNHKVAKPDPLFINKVTTSDMEYFLYKAVDGIKTAIEEGKFRISQSEQQLLDLFKRRQSPLNEWLYENDFKCSALHKHRCKPLYSQFKLWCEENGYTKIMNMYSFKEAICALYDLEIDYVQNDDGGAPAMSFIKRGFYDPNFKPF